MEALRAAVNPDHRAALIWRGRTLLTTAQPPPGSRIRPGDATKLLLFGAVVWWAYRRGSPGD